MSTLSFRSSRGHTGKRKLFDPLLRTFVDFFFEGGTILIALKNGVPERCTSSRSGEE